MSISIKGLKTIGFTTALVDTPIKIYVDGKPNANLRITVVEYQVNSAQQHTMSIMYATVQGSKNVSVGTTQSAQKQLNVLHPPKDPSGNVAANGDVIAYQTDGIWEWNVIDSVSGNIITLVNNIANTIENNKKVAILGTHLDYQFRSVFPGAAGGKLTRREDVFESPYSSEPIFISIDNVGVQGQLQQLNIESVEYV